MKEIHDRLMDLERRVAGLEAHPVMQPGATKPAMPTIVEQPKEVEKKEAVEEKKHAVAGKKR